MSLSRLFRRAGRTLALLGVLSLLACGGRVPLYAAPAMLARGLHVRVFKAYLDDDRVVVRSFVMNTSDEHLNVDRHGWAVRLPGGQVLPWVSERHTVYSLAPGEGHKVFAHFELVGVDLTSLEGVQLLVGGVTSGHDPVPRIVGEVPLRATWTGRAPAPEAAPSPVDNGPLPAALPEPRSGG